MSWDSIKEKGSRFVKIDAGKSARVHLLSEPEDKIVHYVDKKYTPCMGVDCSHCEQAIPPVERFSAEVFNFERKLKQTLEGPVTIARDMKKVWLAYKKDLEGVDFVISKSEGSPVKYTVINLPTEFHPDMLKPQDVPF